MLVTLEYLMAMEVGTVGGVVSTVLCFYGLLMIYANTEGLQNAT